MLFYVFAGVSTMVTLGMMYCVYWIHCRGYFDFPTLVRRFKKRL